MKIHEVWILPLFYIIVSAVPFLFTMGVMAIGSGMANGNATFFVYYHEQSGGHLFRENINKDFIFSGILPFF